MEKTRTQETELKHVTNPPIFFFYIHILMTVYVLNKNDFFVLK